ncbi:MAG: hypothetical protein EXS63_08300 [Candidatus Omnitrophica bacterium]|nr:hypothetical protein [Candidatus Omnitrophota bacterium]
MKNAWVLARKDSAAYFNSWTGIVMLTLFALVAGIFFLFPLVTYTKMSLQASPEAYAGLKGFSPSRFVFGSFFLNFGNVMICVVPFLSMRALAEERSLQTLELLFTYPLSDFDIVWGKFLGMIRFFFFLTLPTLSYLFLFHWIGAEMDWGVIAAGYLGFFLLGTSYLALGLFISSISANQMISAMITFTLLLGFWVLEWVSSVTDGAWAHFFSALSPFGHYRDFTLGILDRSDISYFVFFNLYFLFLTLRSIEVRNWKG